MPELQELMKLLEETRQLYRRTEHVASTSEGHQGRALHAAVQYLKCAADMLREAKNREG